MASTVQQQQGGLCGWNRENEGEKRREVESEKYILIGPLWLLDGDGAA